MTHEYWVNNQDALRDMSEQLKLRVSTTDQLLALDNHQFVCCLTLPCMCAVLQVTAHLWPALFPTYDFPKEVALQDRAMHKVRNDMPTKQDHGKPHTT